MNSLLGLSLKTENKKCTAFSERCNYNKASLKIVWIDDKDNDKPQEVIINGKTCKI